MLIPKNLSDLCRQSPLLKGKSNLHCSLVCLPSKTQQTLSPLPFLLALRKHSHHHQALVSDGGNGIVTKSACSATCVSLAGRGKSPSITKYHGNKGA